MEKLKEYENILVVLCLSCRGKFERKNFKVSVTQKTESKLTEKKFKSFLVIVGVFPSLIK